MKYYELTILDLPVVTMAHAFETDKNETWTAGYGENGIEISYIDKGRIAFYDEAWNLICSYSENDVFSTCISKYNVSPEHEAHRHLTFAFMAQEVNEVQTDEEVLEIASRLAGHRGTKAIIPQKFEKSDSAFVSAKIKQIIDTFYSGDVFKDIKNSAYLLELLSYSTSRCVEMAQHQISKGVSNFVYCKKAVEYIAEHIQEPISVEAVANCLNVSYAHLSRMFKKQTKMTLVEYINREKVKRMEDMLRSKKLSVSEVSQGVGIQDAKYAARLFKKYTGLTMGAYVKLHLKKLQ